MGGFTEHGSIDLRIQDRILFVEGCGPWNLEAAKNYFGVSFIKNGKKAD